MTDREASMHTHDTASAPWSDASLRDALAGALRIAPEQLNAHANLLQLGLDSMHLMGWLNRFRSRGCQLTLRELYEAPTLAGWSRLAQRDTDRPAVLAATTAAWPTMQDGVAFPLTPVQHAYLVGRAPQQALGGVGCHLYQEFDGAGLAIELLESAIRALIARHPMLRVALRADGLQQWREHCHWPGLAVHDLRELHHSEQTRRLLALRERLGHRVLKVECGETFDFQLSLLPQGRHRLHVNFDLLVLDAASFTLVFEELAALVANRPLPPVRTDYDFRSYLAQLDHETVEARERSQRYWRDKIPHLPAAPTLPLAQEPARIEQVRISRRRAELTNADWVAFQQQAGACGVTPTMALATCFAAVLARWSEQPRLLLNLTLFDRQPLHPAVDRMIADFTNILLLDVCGEGHAFDALAHSNQKTFADAYEHRHWSGVALLRELKKQHRHPHGAPVVFTSNLGRPLYGEGTADALGEPAWGISQTPQVWIDHLAFEHGSSVWLQWDSNAALFPQGLVDTLFDAYVGLVRLLAHDAQAWRQPLPDPMPAAQRDTRARVNATRAPLPVGLLHEGFIHAAARAPDAIALIHRERQLRYAELAAMAQCCAGALTARGVQAGDTVAVSMSKGIGQIVAVLGTLLAGAAYVPVPLDQPSERRRKICNDAGVALVLICQDDRTEAAPAEADDATRALCWQEAIRHAPLTVPVVVHADSPAYVIYTSGSTGTPKGVVISHRGALNTCTALNRRYGIGPDDRVLGLSALHFDLSVYDIFGLLTAEGALVMVDETQRRDPSAWCRLIERHRVTVWNSVPALFDMLLTYSEGFALDAPSRLRVAMLSGDWIGLDLPARFRRFRSNGQLVAMGGATEASIWSNIYDVKAVPPHWKSIPYGYPLPNQHYRVVDQQGRDCPDWVTGELWIGGAGVALGYFNDPHRTARQFVASADGRWYRTGDMGCYWPDGTLEFLGRRDQQVKIGGYRIELGEIDAALHRIAGVKSGVALALGEREKTLAAFVVGADPTLCTERHGEPALPPDYAALFPPRVQQADPCRDSDLDRLVADFLCDHLQRQGLDFTTPLDTAAVLARYGAAPAWHGLVSNWLALLQAQGRLMGGEQKAGYRRGPRYDDPLWLPARQAPLHAIADALRAHHTALSEILRGQRAATTLLSHPFWAPEQLLMLRADTAAALDAFAHALDTLSRMLQRPVHLIEIGARSGVGAAALLQRLDADRLRYTALDASQDMVLRARASLARYPHASVRRLDATVPEQLRHSADVVWANNALHRLDSETLDGMTTLAAPAALLHVLELQCTSPLALVSADLLQQEGRSAAASLRDVDAWQALFQAHGLRCEYADCVGAQQRFALRAPVVVQQPDPQKLSAALAAFLPSYMLPQRWYVIDALPLTSNGKIDHQALAARAAPPVQSASNDEAPSGDTEQQLATLWRKLLETPILHRHSHFFQLGGDSLLATRLMGELDKAGYAAQLGDLFNYPSLADFAATLHRRTDPSATVLQHDPASRYLPFALTDVQQAYLTGRQPGFALGGVGAHFFVEFDVEHLDISRFEAAWNALIVRHDMLRAVVRDGQQRVLPHVPAFVLPRQHFSDLESADVIALRDRLSQQVRDPACWPVFDVQAAYDSSGRHRLYLCLDNLLLDGLSMQILLAELEQRYLDPGCELPPVSIGFRDYLAHIRSQRVKEASKAYWRRRLPTLPTAPQLPLRREPADIGIPRFVRLSDYLPAHRWRALKERAVAAKLTPSGLLLAAYAAVLSAWSERRDLCINLTLFDRQPVHPQIERVLGDFTSLLLLAWQPTEQWLGSAQRLQQQLWQDLDHRDFSALRVMRAMAQRQGHAATEMPVVFTSALGFDHDRFLTHASWLKPRWGISQTPQIWLDHQVYETAGALHFNWDAVEALFEPDQLRAMFAQYTALLQRLAEDDSAWHAALDTLVPRADHSPGAVRLHANRTATATRLTETAHADTTLVAQLCAHFHSVVGQPITARQNFFDAGASSLQLVQLHIHLQQAGYLDLEITDLFAHPSPLALATRLGGSPLLKQEQNEPRLLQRNQRNQRKLRRQEHSR